MLAIAYYFLQVVLCSSIMMVYYLLVLRNKQFHQYNRFYLIAVSLFSWIIPLVKISWTKSEIPSQQIINVLSAVADKNLALETKVVNQAFQWNWPLVGAIVYTVIAVALLFMLCRSCYKVFRLLRTNTHWNLGDIRLILTNVSGTPFSFFKYIFWNEEIDVNSHAGRQILEHELAHVKQKHSLDKLFIQVVLAAGWFNPIFWLLKREMEMIHEFIADKKAIHNGNAAELAQMLLTAAYPKQQFDLANPFFFSPIKRRLKMLTINKTPKFSYLRRIVVLPMLVIVAALFAFRSTENQNIPLSEIKEMENKAIPAKTGIPSKNVDALPIKNTEKKRSFAPPTIVADTVSIREPLYIIDGTKVLRGQLQNTPPDDIASIDVIKDPKAIELFGEEGKNGVIVITSKKAAREQEDWSAQIKKDNPDIKSFRKVINNKLVVEWKDGTTETYDLNNQESYKRAETKYGKF